MAWNKARRGGIGGRKLLLLLLSAAALVLVLALGMRFLGRTNRSPSVAATHQLQLARAVRLNDITICLRETRWVAGQVEQGYRRAGAVCAAARRALRPIDGVRRAHCPGLATAGDRSDDGMASVNEAVEAYLAAYQLLSTQIDRTRRAATSCPDPALLAAFDAVKRTRATAQKRLAETAMAPSN